MILAQLIIAFPLVAGFTMAAVLGVNPALRLQIRALGATRWQTALATLAEARVGVLVAVVAGFGSWLVSGVYIVAIALLCSHLSHGFSSVFQTLGLRTEKSWPVIVRAGQAYTLLILLGNWSIPLAVLLGIVSP